METTRGGSLGVALLANSVEYIHELFAQYPIPTSQCNAV